MSKLEQTVLLMRIKSLREIWYDRTAALHTLEGAVSETRGKLIATLKEYLGKERIEIGDWACKESPILCCVYDTAEDIACDHCLFCGNPDERK